MTKERHKRPKRGNTAPAKGQIIPINAKRPAAPKKKRERSQKTDWYKMTSFFDGAGQQVSQVGDEGVVLAGWIPPDNDVAVCLVPTSITQDQGLALEKLLEAHLRAPVLLLSNNVQLVRLRKIPAEEARQLMESQDGKSSILQFQGQEGPETSDSGEEGPKEGA